MRYWFVLTSLAVALSAPSAAAAQSVQTEVTLKVPVNLTDFGPDVAKIRLSCVITSSAITNGSSTGAIAKYSDEIPMTAGKVATTVSITFSPVALSLNPVGKTASVFCEIAGWSTSLSSWYNFHGGATNPAFKTTTTAGAAPLTTSFVW